MVKSFGEQLREKLNEAGIKAAELSRRSGVTKQNIGRLLNNTPHSITGAAPKVETETVIKLAKPLNWDIDDALLAAGYAAGSDEDGLRIDLGDDVRVSMRHGKSYTPQERAIFEITLKSAIEDAKKIIEASAIGEIEMVSEAIPKVTRARQTGNVEPATDLDTIDAPPLETLEPVRKKKTGT